MAANLDKSENALTNVTTVTYVRGIDASGNSVKISTANLASVLGATYTILQGGIDLNDIITPGRYNIGNVSAVANSPWESGNFSAYLWVLGVGSINYGLQIIAHNLLTNGIYIRSTRGGMNTWRQIL